MSNLNYVEYDFDDLVNQLIARVQNQDAWKDTYRSSTGRMLIELLAYVGNLLLYYVERRAEECYIDTAKLRSSVINLVRLLNYTPRRKTSATGILTFSIPSPVSKNIYIPQWTLCSTSDGTKYVVIEDGVILKGGTSVDVNAVQGEKIDIEYTSPGTANLEVNVKDTSVENTHLYVYVDGEQWTAVSSFIESEPDSKHYRVRYELDDTVTIVFGDGVYGKIPPSGSTILIRYVKSDGVNGNVYQTDKITTILSSIYDEDGNKVTDISVTNSSLFLGGEDAETTEEIRYLAPRVFATGDRAVTRADFIAILENYPGVATANVWGENEEDPPNYDMFNRVKICLVLQNWELPGEVFKSNLSEYLYTKSMMTVKYEYVDAQIINVIPVISLKVLSGYTLSEVQGNVENTLQDQFELGNTAKLGLSKRLSDLIDAVEGVDGVSYHHMTLEIRKELQSNYSSGYDYGETLKATPILAESVKVYDGDVQIAVDDGSGGFTSVESGYTVSGSIDYTTGIINLNISPAPSGVVYVRYQQDANGDIEVDKDEICKLYDVDFVSVSYVS